MTKRLRILIIDDEALIREGLRALLSKEDDVFAISEAWDEESVKVELAVQPIDIVLLDVRLKSLSGLTLLGVIKTDPSAPKVIAVTGLEGEEVVISLLKAGVDGIVFKLDGYLPIWEAVQKVKYGGHYYSQRTAEIIQSNAHRWAQTTPATLNFSENELLVGIAKGMTNKEIAVALKMSPATIETYRVRLIKKLGATNTASLIAYAFRNGLL